MQRVFVVNGPNLNLLGSRSPDVYGSTTLMGLEELLGTWGDELGVEVETFQTNHEGTIIDRLHAADADAVVLNPGAYTHYSYAIHDAIEAIAPPVVEVHISDIRNREPWRRHSVTAPACVYAIHGRGIEGYRWALRHLVARAAWPVETIRYGLDDELIADLRLPEGTGPHPVAVVIHGGFWRDPWTRDVMDMVAIDLSERGWATWNIEYRRIGGGGGWPLTFEDVAAAVDSLAGLAEGRSLDLSRVVTIGHSAGGHLAVWAAGRRSGDPAGEPVVPVTGTVSVSGILDLVSAYHNGIGGGAIEELLRRTPEDDEEGRYRRSDPLQRLPLGVPIALVHGESDATVPASMSRAFAVAATDAGDSAALIVREGIGHMDLIDPRSAAWGAVVDALTAVG